MYNYKCKKMKLYNSTLDKKWQINIDNSLKINKYNSIVQFYSFIFFASWNTYFWVLYPSVLYLLIFLLLGR